LAAGLVASEVNWLLDSAREPLSCTAKIRYRHRPAAAMVSLAPGDGAVVFCHVSRAWVMAS
jgi:tRNA-specific 2-thiouridylase